MPRLHIRSMLKYNRLSLVEGHGLQHHFPLHTHHALIIGLLTAGIRLMIYREESVTIQPGEIFIVNPGEAHACRPMGKQALDYRILCIQPDLLPNGFIGKYRFEHHLKNPQVVQSLITCFQELDTCLPEKREAILSGFIRQFYEQWGTLSDGKKALPVVEQTRLYLEVHSGEKVNIRQLGQAVSLSPYHLNRLFHRCTGITPHAYQLQIKIQRAQELLNQGSSPIEAAIELGFSDQSHFSRFFKKYVGLSPAAYRRQNRKVDISADEIVRIVREGRERGY